MKGLVKCQILKNINFLLGMYKKLNSLCKQSSWLGAWLAGSANQ